MGVDSGLLKAMGPEKEIVLYEGLAHPILCRKVRYYQDSYFTKRLLPKVEVQPLPLEASHAHRNDVRDRVADDERTRASLSAG